MRALMRNNNTSAMPAVSRPPAKSTRPVPEQIAHAFHVAHDARDQGAGLVGVVIRNRQARNVCLHFLAKLGNQALRGLRKQLRQSEKM